MVIEMQSLQGVPEKNPSLEITLLYSKCVCYISGNLNELNMNGGSIFIFPSSK